MRLIDAHKLEKEFKRIYNCSPMNCQSLDWGTIKNTIRDSPEVDPVKHAHWTEKYDGYMILQACLICNAYAITKSNYCPHCGAKMDENERTLKYADQDTMMSAT